MTNLLVRLPLWASIVGAAQAALLPVPVNSTVCDTLQASTNIPQYRLGSPAFANEQTQYWSTASSALVPACIIAPTTAQDMATVVQVLRNSNERFAIKSGGHSPNNYFASIDGGPLVSTLNLKQVVLDTATETVRIGPGSRWDAVGKVLDGTGYAVVGGRIGNVGVGGYMLGGGLSFMSTEYGWAANNVVAYELVLANATVITVTNSSNPDLFLALKGGGNNFGIVTSFVVQAHRQGQIWGGNLFFNATPAANAAMLEAIRDFTQNYSDVKAALIPTAEITAAGVIDMWTLFLYYNGPTPPPGIFDRFLALKPFTNTCKTRSYSDLLSFNNWSVIKGTVFSIGTETLPLPDATTHAQQGLSALQSIHAHWRNVTLDFQLVPGGVGTIAFQPFPKKLAKLARDLGGDMYDFDDDVDRILVEMDYSCLLTTDYPKVDATMTAAYSGIKDRVQAFTAAGTLPQSFSPLFQNDCHYRQDFFGRLKPARQQLALQVRNDVDPSGLWRDRTAGFKFGN